MISEKRTGYKSWSNLKKQMHDLLCDSLKDKISYFYTSYHEVHNAYGRAAINYNKKEIAVFSWVEQYAQQHDIIEQYKKMENVPSVLVDYEGSVNAYKTANAVATKEKWMPNCTLCETDFINSITIYLKTDIATSLNSDNYLLRVFAYMDRRVGKRTLIKIKDDVEKLPDWVKQFYQIRCEADGIIFPPKRITDESIVCLTQEKIAHEMKLNPAPFAMIKSGRKTIELRLFDEKRRKIKVGDGITFTNTDTGEKLTKTVKALHRFDSFETLYKTLPLLQCGYTEADVDNAHPSDMAQYYSPEEQAQFGVVGIELC